MICPSRRHIRARTHMALDSGKGVFEELLKIFEECRQPNWDGYGAQAVREETYDLAHQFLAALPLSIPLRSWGRSGFAGRKRSGLKCHGC